MFDLIWDIYQQGLIGDAQKRADHAVASAQRAKAEAPSVDARVDRLTLITCALWELLRDRSDLKEADLINKMREIDLRDGVEDGKVGIPAVKCSSCGRTISAKDATCIYCAEDNSKKIKIIFR